MLREYDTSSTRSVFDVFIIYCRLKELEFTLTISDDQGMWDTIDFFSSQKELRKVDLTLVVPPLEPRLMKTVLFHILRKLPKLAVFAFHSDCELKLSQYEFADFVMTLRNLESLDLRFIESSIDPTSESHPLPSRDMKYPKLKRLRLNIGSAEVTQLQSEILSRCLSLEYLSLGVVDLNTVALVCTDHVCIPLLECDVFLTVVRMLSLWK